MGSLNPQVDLYDPKTLKALAQAFDATWVEVQARIRDFERDSELKTAINQKLWALARDGVTDPSNFASGPLRASRDNDENLDTESPFGS